MESEYFAKIYITPISYAPGGTRIIFFSIWDYNGITEEFITQVFMHINAR